MDQPRTQETNQSTVKDGFGVHLRREREMRGVTLEEISSATRIGTRFLDALETEHWERLPGGVFNRGFVRTTAQFLGLDPEAMLAEYTLATTDATRAVPPVYIHAQSSWTPRTAPGARDRSWLPWIVLIAIAAVAAGGWFGWRHIRALRRARAADAALAAGNSAGAATDPGQAVSPAAGETTDAVSTPPASQPAADSSPAPDATAATAPTAPPGANDDAATPAEAAVPAGAAAAAPSASTTAPPASAPASASAPLELKIEAGRATSVRVSVDGHKTFQGKIPAGGSKTFQANEVFYVTARDAGGVLLELNGQTLPPLGPQGRSGSIRLTRETLKQQDGTSH
jgi:cytoskeleton protein RodZ